MDNNIENLTKRITYHFAISAYRYLSPYPVEKSKGNAKKYTELEKI